MLFISQIKKDIPNKCSQFGGYLYSREYYRADMYFGNIMFKNKADVQYVIDNPNFREVLNNIFKV